MKPIPRISFWVISSAFNIEIGLQAYQNCPCLEIQTGVKKNPYDGGKNSRCHRIHFQNIF